MRRKHIHNIITTLMVMFIVLIILFPFYSMVILSIIPEEVYIQEGFVLFPNKFTFDSYIYVFSNKSLWTAFLTSSVVTVVGVIYNLILTTTSAYVLTVKFPGKRIYVILVFIALFFDGGLIANYLVISNLGLIDNILSMILPTGIEVSFLLLLTKQFRQVPQSVLDAAKIDGANDIQILFRIFVPMTTPMITALALYYAVDRWNEWYLGMLYMNKMGAQPMQLVLRNIISNANPIKPTEIMQAMGAMPFSLGIKMACTIITMIPIIVAFPFIQRKFISDLNDSIKE